MHSKNYNILGSKAVAFRTHPDFHILSPDKKCKLNVNFWPMGGSRLCASNIKYKIEPQLDLFAFKHLFDKILGNYPAEIGAHAIVPYNQTIQYLKLDLIFRLIEDNKKGYTKFLSKKGI